MYFHLADLARKQRYKLIAGAIVPRPIALITTCNADGSVNAAPFSAFNYMSEDPPLVAVGLQVHPDGSEREGQPKDTAANIARTGEFVVNIADEPMLPDLVDCAIDFPPGDSEVERLGLPLEPSLHIDPPRLAAAPFAFECRRKVALDFGPFRTIVIGEVVGVHVREGIVDPVTLNVDLDAFRPVGRLAGSWYAWQRERQSVPIPTLAVFEKEGPLRHRFLQGDEALRE